MKNRPQYFINLKFAVCLLLLSVFCPFVLAQDKPPLAAVKEVTDDYFGQKIVDPYRWMEDGKSAELAGWVKAQNDYTRGFLDKLPGRTEILKRLNELSESGVVVGGIKRAGNLYFYYRLAPGENNRKLYVREGLSGVEKLLVDPDKLSENGKSYSITAYSLSPDGKFVSYLLSPGGAEYGDIRILDVSNGRETGDRIEGTRWDAGAWLPDGRSFIYLRFQKLAPDALPPERLQKIRLYRHTLGTPADADKVMFGFEVNPNIKFETTFIPFPSVPRGSKYAFVSANSGVETNIEIYAAPVAALEQSIVPWRKIAAMEDEIGAFDIRGDDLYLLTYKNTPRYKVIRTNVNQADLKKAVDAFPASEAVVEFVRAARDAFYVQVLDGGLRKIWRVDYKTNKAALVKLPYEGSASFRAVDAQTDGVLFALGSWTKSIAYYSFDPKTGTSNDARIAPPIPVDMSGIEVTNVKAKSWDGTLVPMVILHKRGLKRDGKNPTLLDGYGAYGAEWTSPVFAANLLPWLERGGVMAFAGVRGGGEYGEEWHLAGFQKTKPNTWKDFIACAEYLVAEKYTSPAHLAGQSVSAGGILISNAITERPDLFGAAIDLVGVNNPLRFELTANGVANIPEFGSVKTVEGFRSLLAMDGYNKIKNGVKYPAVLLTTGINDPRVEPWLSAKMAARLQAATSSGKPVLLRVDYEGGHGLVTGKQQRNEEQADIFAFLFEQLK
jgi:prolyl oligopeptidase